jgi:hypothetical protein
MRIDTWNIVVAGAVIAVVALVAVWIAMIGGYIGTMDADYEWFENPSEEDPDGSPSDPGSNVHVPGGGGLLVSEPADTIDPDASGTGEDDLPFEIEDLKRLAELEGQQDFSKAYYDPYDNYRYDRYYTFGFDAVEIAEADMALRGSEVPYEIRDIEEADLVKVEGDFIYILNPYRGLLIFDISDPDNPVGLGSAGILGDPVEMYVVGDRAYVIVSTSFGYWYRFSSWNMFMVDSFSPRYQIGTQLVIIDISDRTRPSIIKEVGVEGFVTDSRRVGKVIYLVSNCYGWYNHYSNTQMMDSTYVMSLNIRDPENIMIIDEVSFPGSSNEIHVTVDHLYVSQWSYDWGWRSRYGQSNITIVDISHPDGAIVVMDTFPVEGHVNDRYQMDEWDGIFRVVSHFFIGIGQSELFTFDISDPWNVEALGHLVIDDNGQLMATRFAGDRGYTIHLPRSIDPLDVLDLSDPSDPVLCDVFEMPGWVTHMEVRGYKIIAIGVDDSDDARNVAVSLFDVSDPWNVVMEQRVRLGGDYAYSSANWDPKALTVLDDQGLVLIPYSSYTNDGLGYRRYYNAVQVVGFDLKDGELELGGHFEQPDSVTRTRSVNGRVLATSSGFLQVANVKDIHNPEVMATVELCPNVVDHRVIGGYTTLLVRELDSGDLLLRTYAKGLDEMSEPIVDMFVSTPNVKWFWEGRNIFVLSIEEIADRNWKATVSRIDVTDPRDPDVTEFTFMITKPDGKYSYGEYPGSSWMYTNSYYWDWGYGFNLEDVPSNPVMIGDSSMAYYLFGTIYLLDVEGSNLGVISSLEVETETFLGLMARSDRILLVEYDYHYNNNEIHYNRYYRGGFRYTVHSVDIRYDGVMTETDEHSVPGIPVGASDDGEKVYTISLWYDYEYGMDQSSRALNVVSLTGDDAITLMVLDLTGKGVTVIGDKAVVIETIMVNVTNEELGTNSSENYTVVRSISLEDLSELRRDVLVGRFTPRAVGDDFLMLHNPEQSGLTVLNLRSNADGPALGYYKVRDNIVSAHRQGDVIYLVQGMYGVSGFQLPA